MGIFNFFKKKNIELETTQKEEIEFGQINGWILQKRDENKLKEKEIFDLIDEKIIDFSNQIKQKTRFVQEFNLEEKKVEEKLKSVTNQGREIYLESLEAFLDKLTNLKKEKFEKLIEDINRIFLEFNKSSNLSYERATILIGKEMATIKNLIKIFSKELIKIFDENKKLSEASKIFSTIESKLKQIEETDLIIKRIKESITSLNNSLNNKKEENEKLEKELKNIRESESYLKNIQNQNKIKQLKQELGNKVIFLKQQIDFKALANFFHSMNREMNQVKEYRQNFLATFNEEGAQTILNLLDWSKLNKEIIPKLIKEINKKKEELQEINKEIKKDETINLEHRLNNFPEEVKDLDNEIKMEEKKCERIKANKEEQIQTIINEMKNLNAEIINF